MPGYHVDVVDGLDFVDVVAIDPGVEHLVQRVDQGHNLPINNSGMNS